MNRLTILMISYHKRIMTCDDGHWDDDDDDDDDEDDDDDDDDDAVSRVN